MFSQAAAYYTLTHIINTLMASTENNTWFAGIMHEWSSGILKKNAPFLSLDSGGIIKQLHRKIAVTKQKNCAYVQYNMRSIVKLQ